jgi:hypothetical protein
MVNSHLLRPRVLLGAALLAGLLPLAVVWACGPFFEPEVFTPAQHPQDLQLFATGKLGILQPTYWQADHVVAFRYLNGGHLSKAEQLAYAPPPAPTPTGTWEQQQKAQLEQTAAYRWTQARSGFTQRPLAKAPTANRTVEIQHPGFVEQDELLNCPDNAFDTAIATLQSRAQTWGRQSADLQNWILGQDAVFANCSDPAGVMPTPAPANAGQPLKQDRAYQTAAAHFYALQYNEALSGFLAIAQDKSSPWARWGEYLAARAEIRKAAATIPTVESGDGLANFDPALMQSAQARLTRVAQTSDPQIKHAALAELSFVNVRLDPEAHLNEAANALAGPSPDPEFARHLDDLRFLADHNVTGDAELLRWMGLSAKINLADEWRSSKSLPWLIAAIAAAKPADPETPGLIAAAAALAPSSPGYATANYHRIRLLILSGQLQQARDLATTLLSSLPSKKMAGSRNAVLGLRMTTAPTFIAFLEDAPRQVIDSGYSPEYSPGTAPDTLCIHMDSGNCVEQIPSTQFELDSVAAFNSQLPLSFWMTASDSHSPLPQNLREGIAWAGWVRAVQLDDIAAAAHLAPSLPASVRAIAGDSTGFPATLAMLSNPGLRPYIEQGVQRTVTFHQLDDYRDNWWVDSTDLSQDWRNESLAMQPPRTPLTFLTPEERDRAQKELETLKNLPPGVTWLGRRAIDYVKAHPDDPHAAESLYLTVRATRYSPYIDQAKQSAQQSVSKEAFELLHRRYPKSTWAAKTPYYY